MAIYVVTGKLGGGKTLAAVSKIDQALGKGLRVATNLDLNVHLLPSCSRRTKNTRVIRVPDHPSVDDIKVLGRGAFGEYDESKFGVLVLDECGTWLNSRDWQAEGRRELISYLLHIRKMRWDVFLIIQDVSLLDKQCRKALAEHVVYCRRFDRLPIPFLSTFAKVFGVQIRGPRMHMGLVKYGDQPQSLTVDRWMYRGTDLYDAYDTSQIFDAEYSDGVVSLVPPFTRFCGSFVAWDWRKRMRLTRIVLRKWSQTVLLSAGIVAGAVGTVAIAGNGTPKIDDIGSSIPVEWTDAAAPLGADTALRAVAGLQIGSIRLTSRMTWPDGRETVHFGTGDGVDYRLHELPNIGITAVRVGTCAWRLNDGRFTRVVECWD